MDLVISKVKEDQHLLEDELQLLSEYMNWLHSKHDGQKRSLKWIPASTRLASFWISGNRLVDGSKRVHVPHFLSAQSYDDHKKQRRSRDDRAMFL